MKPEPIQDAALRDHAQRLGRAAAERFDVERAAEGVLHRLRRERIVGRATGVRWLRSAWLRAAAAIVLVFGAGLIVRGVVHERESQTYLVVDDLGDLSAGQLREVLGTLDQTLQTPVPEAAPEDLNDLTTEQLEAVLRSLEG
jgi:hypothetical protein